MPDYDLLEGASFDDEGHLVRETQQQQEAVEETANNSETEAEPAVEETATKEAEADQTGEEVAAPDVEEKPKSSYAQLRAHKEALEADLQAAKARLEPISAKLEQVGGEAVLDTAVGLYGAYTGVEGSPEAFAKTLYDLSPSRYGELVATIVGNHQEAIVKQLTGLDDITTADIEEFKQFKAAGGLEGIKLIHGTDDDIPVYDAEGNLLTEEQRTEIKRWRDSYRAAEQLRQQMNEQAEKAKQDAAYKEFESKKNAYESKVYEVVDSTSKTLGWDATDGESGERNGILRDMVKEYATTRFNRDANNVALYQRAMGYLHNGEEKLAESLLKHIQTKYAAEVQSVAKLLSDGMTAQPEAKQKEIQQATKAKKEVSSSGGVSASSMGVKATSKSPAWADLDSQIDEIFAKRGKA